MTEKKALNLLRARQPRALAWFIDRYSSYVGTIVSGILMNSMSQADVEEVTADVFVALWNSADTLAPVNLKGWLGRVARNLSFRKLRERRSDLPLDEDILVLEEDSLIEKLDQAERNRLVREAVLSLGQPDREIFLRFYYYCQSVERIADAMRMNPSTVKTRLRRGREKLRHHLNGKNITGGE